MEYLLPACLLVFGITTLAVAILGFATTGEMDTAVTGISWSYYFSGVLGLVCAFICYRYPVRYLLAAGLASMYYMLHFWLFWGSGFAAAVPPDPVMMPVLFLVALSEALFLHLLHMASAVFSGTMERLTDRILPINEKCLSGSIC